MIAVRQKKPRKPLDINRFGRSGSCCVRRPGAAKRRDCLYFGLGPWNPLRRLLRAPDACIVPAQCDDGRRHSDSDL